jgi:hypothetical protein
MRAEKGCMAGWSETNKVLVSGARALKPTINNKTVKMSLLNLE